MKKLWLILPVFCALFFFKCSKQHEASIDNVPGEIVVDFKDDVSDSYIAELSKKYSVKFHPQSRYSSVDKIYVGNFDGNESDLINKLRDESKIEAVDREMIYSIPELVLNDNPISVNVDSARKNPNDPKFHLQWHMRQIHLPDDWATNGRNGNGVIVAVIDTGVSRVEDLDPMHFVKGYNFVSNNTNADDDNGHGTHCAGTIAQWTNNGVGVTGVANRALIMPLKVLGANGSGTSAAIAQAIDYATDNGAEVISMSLGGGGYNSVMAKAVKRAHDKGVVVVAAAGNSSRGTVSYPAAYPGAIAVAATQADERVTFYSNWGKEIAIAAPGGNTRENPQGGVLQNTIKDGKEGYYFFMGTSMATPHVAGVAALLIGEGVIRNPDKVRQIMLETARMPVGMKSKPKDYAEHYGAGIIDAKKAVEAVRGTNKHHIALYVLAGFVLLLIMYFLVRKK